MSKKPTPLKAIREKCLDCAGNAREVRNCPVKDCPLYLFRFGKKPPKKPLKKGGIDTRIGKCMSEAK